MKAMLSSVLERFFTSGLITASAIVFAGSLAVNITNYVFTLIMGRLLGVEHFGEVSALMSLLVIVTVPATALSMFMAREAAQRDSAQAHALFSRLRVYVISTALLVWVLFMLAIPTVASYLNIAYLPVAIFSVLLPLSILTAQQSGTLQGLHSFTALSTQNVLQALAKLLVSIALVSIGYSVAGVMSALVIASFITWGFGAIALTRAFAQHTDTSHAEVSSNTQAPSTLTAHVIGIFVLTALLLALLQNVDIVLAKHYLSPELAGQYAALSTVGKIIVYGLGVVGTVLLPMAASAHARNDGGARRIGTYALLAVAAGAVCGAAVFAIFSNLVISILFGERYIAIAPHLGLFAVAMGAVAVSITFVQYFIATHNRTFLWFLTLGLALEIVLITFNHATIEAIVSSVTIGSLALLALMCFTFVITGRSAPLPIIN